MTRTTAAGHRPSAPVGVGSGWDRAATYRALKQWVTTAVTEAPVTSVVVATHNAGQAILPTVGAVAVQLCGRGEPWELIVADDGSTDDTIEALDALAFPNLRVLPNSRREGRGAALRRGVAAARGQWLLIVGAEADQVAPVEQYDTLRVVAEAGEVPVVVGSQAGGSAGRDSSGPRALLDGALHLLARQCAPTDVSLARPVLLLLAADAAATLFRLQAIDDASVELEVLYLCRRLGLTVVEVPVQWQDGARQSSSTLPDVEPLWRAARVRLNELRGRYRRLSPGSGGAGTSLPRRRLAVPALAMAPAEPGATTAAPARRAGPTVSGPRRTTATASSATDATGTSASTVSRTTGSTGTATSTSTGGLDGAEHASRS